MAKRRSLAGLWQPQAGGRVQFGVFLKSNLKAFDDALGRLERKAPDERSEPQLLKHQVEVWESTVNEFERYASEASV